MDYVHLESREIHDYILFVFPVIVVSFLIVVIKNI